MTTMQAYLAVILFLAPVKNLALVPMTRMQLLVQGRRGWHGQQWCHATSQLAQADKGRPATLWQGGRQVIMHLQTYLWTPNYDLIEWRISNASHSIELSSIRWKKTLKSFCSNPSLITSHPSEGKIKPCQQLVDDLLSRQLHIRRGVDRDKMLLCSMRSFRGELNWALIILWTKSFGQNLRVAISGGEAVSVVRVRASISGVIFSNSYSLISCLINLSLLSPQTRAPDTLRSDDYRVKTFPA